MRGPLRQLTSQQPVGAVTEDRVLSQASSRWLRFAVAIPKELLRKQRTCAAAMSPRPLLPFTPSTTFSHRDIEQRVGPRSPRTPRLDAAFSAVPMRGVVLPGRFSVGPRDFSRFE